MPELKRRGFVLGAGASLGALGLGCGARPRSSADPLARQVRAQTAAGARAGQGEAREEQGPFAELAGSCAGAEPIARAEFEARIERVRAELARREQAALIVEAGVDLRYLGGPRWGLSERPLLLLVPRAAEPVIIAPAFEQGSLEARQGPLKFPVRAWQEHESPYALAVASLREAELPGATVAVAAATRSFVVEGLRDADSKLGFDAHPGALAAVRRVKSPAELALLRRANEATKAALAHAAGLAVAGMHEREFAELVREAQLAAGLEGVWVLPLFGPNAAYPHGTPEGRELAEGDLILVDTGGFLHGYASDITRTWAFPDPAAVDDERRRAWDLVRSAQSAALETIQPGVRCAEVDAAAREVFAAAGFDGDYGQFTHRLGHGIGMQVHEPPYLVRNAQHRLEVGNTMSDEPGLYLPGAFGIRLEDILVVGEEGAEVFGPRATSLDAPFG